MKKEVRSNEEPSPGRRLALLLALLLLGFAIGQAGFHFTGDQRWFLAIPALLAVAWLFLANSRCLLPDGEKRGNRKP